MNEREPIDQAQEQRYGRREDAGGAENQAHKEWYFGIRVGLRFFRPGLFSMGGRGELRPSRNSYEPSI
jgi:hypothetical protein